MASFSKLNLMLLGKTGSGKSCVGNTLLGRIAFETNSKFDACTKHQQIGSATVQGRKINVVDTPGLLDNPCLEFFETREEHSYNFYYDGFLSQSDVTRVDAFLIVVKFAVRFTQEDLDVLYDVKKYFGEGFMKHSIIVVSGGDHFNDVFQEKRNVSFHDWIREQSGCFRELLEACRGRCVLFNNKEKDPVSNQAQVRHLLELVETLKSFRGSYSPRFEQLFSNKRADTSTFKANKLLRKYLKDLNTAYRQMVYVSRIQDLEERIREIKLQNEKCSHGRKESVGDSEVFLSWSTAVAFVTTTFRHMGSVVTSIVTSNVDNKTEHIKLE